MACSAWICAAFFSALSLSAVLGPGSLAAGAATLPAKGREQARFRLEVEDAHGVVIAASATSGKETRGESAALAFEHTVQPGDRIVVHGPSQMAVRVDDWMPECLVYRPNSSEGAFSFVLPSGKAGAGARSPYSGESFAGAWHRVTARRLTAEERSGYRNLAGNMCDQTPEPTVFPHASTNSASRGLAEFEARNAIDGMTENGHHGVWPYQSWGPELRPDVWWKVEFGRPVAVDKIRLMVRADFPHDSYWQSAVIEFSDGGQLPIRMIQSAEFQDFTFPKRTVSWIRINKLVAADPARWRSLIEVEAWGHDLK